MADNRRAPLSRPKQWLLVTGRRRSVTLTLFAFVFFALLGLSLLNPVDMRKLLTEQSTVQTLFNTLLSGIILLVSIVVSVNSLVVSQELTPIDRQHERVVESWNFREQAAERLDETTTPADPSDFLAALVKGIDDKLSDLVTTESLSEDPREEVHQYVERTREDMGRTDELLTGADDVSFDVALFGPAYDPSVHIEQARRLRGRHNEALPDGLDRRMDDVVSALQHFASAREYFKTVYYKREFSYLSRDLLYTGLPSILLISYLLLALDANIFAGTTLGVANVLLFVTLMYTVALSPFLVLTSYTLRAAVIAEQTTASGGFIIGGRGRANDQRSTLSSSGYDLDPASAQEPTRTDD